ncbi:MAG: UDP-N-acetylmuramate--L-alanine ligase [Planctomycetota bacterium]|jgi:UDP-N-acetylmuramate--alanine ligase
MIAHDLIDLSHPRRLHLLGIGGTGMRPFALLLAAEGHRISGSDARDPSELSDLAAAGIRVDPEPLDIGEVLRALDGGVEGVIHSAAVPVDHPIIREARTLGIPVLKYARAVGLYSRDKSTLAVAGTHGKTTTTALLAHVLRRGGLDPSYLVGGSVPQLPQPGVGRSDLLAVEACEFDRSFLHFAPKIAIVTNIEADHLDYYRDLVEITAAFQSFSTQVSDLLVLHENLRETVGRAGGVRARVKTFGPSPDADLRVLPMSGGAGFHGSTSHGAGRAYPMLLPGFHNSLNAAAVILVAEELGLDREAVVRALADFEGVGRRLQMIGRPRGIAVVDDYAHHPTEVAAGLRALRDAYAPRRLWVVFQPHQYSRLRRFLPEFAAALATADRIVVPPVFAARDGEDDRRAVSSTDLVSRVRGLGADAIHIPDHNGVIDFVRTQARSGDVVVTMGAGDIGHVAGQLANAL